MVFSPPKIVVIGSLNIDYIASVKALPKAGETVSARDLIQRFGGKGANQAIAAARQGAVVGLIGCVGSDDAGRAYQKRMADEGIAIKGIFATNKALTGTALIAVDADGENLIIVAPGANGELTPSMVRSHKKWIAAAKMVLLQNEVPLATVGAAIQMANKAGVPVVLNPSPLRKDFPWGDCNIDALIVNDGEAQAIFKMPATAISRALPKWRRALAKYNLQRLIVTRGAASTLYLDQEVFAEVPTVTVKPLDTVGAGDAFAGAFCVCRSVGMEILSAVRHANAAGALTTLLPGAQEAAPTRSATEKFLRLKVR